VASRRGAGLAASAGLLVVVGAVAAALINELHGGWGWWVAAGAAVLVWAVGTGFVAFRTGDTGGSVRVGEGGAYSGGSIRGGVTTRTTIRGPSLAPGAVGEGVDVGRGAVFAADNISGPVHTETYIDPQGSSGETGEQRGRGPTPPTLAG